MQVCGYQGDKFFLYTLQWKKSPIQRAPSGWWQYWGGGGGGMAVVDNFVEFNNTVKLMLCHEEQV